MRRPPTRTTDLLCIDPGVKWCGAARFLSGALVQAWLHDSSETAVGAADLGVVEIMQVYAGRKVPPADLIRVTAAAGRAAGLCREVLYQEPREWKGQQSKAAQHRKMWAALSAEEIQILEGLTCRPSLRHNVYDAACIGLRYLGRL